jgi:hypothetical protein
MRHELIHRWHCTPAWHQETMKIQVIHARDKGIRSS